MKKIILWLLPKLRLKGYIIVQVAEVWECNKRSASYNVIGIFLTKQDAESYIDKAHRRTDMSYFYQIKEFNIGKL